MSTLEQLRVRKKNGGPPAVGVSCYTAPDALLAAEAGVDFIVVGDSLAMTLLGFDSTLPATMEMMELFTAAVRRGLPPDAPLVVGDMPLGSYQPSNEVAVTNACRLVQAGADVVKIEGCTPLVLDRIGAITQSGIGVVAHLGLQPQQKALVGGWRVQAKTAQDAYALQLDVQLAFRAGASIVLIEAVPAEVAASISVEEKERLVYGIGAGPGVDGQLLVMSDLIGEFRPFKSRFAKRFGAVEVEKRTALHDYVAAVRERTFPDAETSYPMDPVELKLLKRGLR